MTPPNMLPTTRGHPGSSKKSTEEMELLPCVARPTSVSGRKTSSAARGSTREPTRSPKTSTWMFCCRRSPDPVPTEVSVSLTIKCIHIYKRELDFLTFTLKENY